MKTLHVHIGTPKTGTTSIQEFCMENSDILNSKGYCYPIMPFTFPDALEARNARFLVGDVFDKDGKASVEVAEKNFHEGVRRILELFEKFEHVVLSDENIWLNMDVSRKDLWKNLKKEADKAGFLIHVIVYLRRQDKYLYSLWNQRVKSRRRIDVSYEDYVGNINLSVRLDYYNKLERMAGVIGKENITVRRFDGGNFVGGSIYSDFLLAIGLTLTEEYKISQGERNPGLYGNTFEIKRILNSLPQMGDPKIHQFMKERLWECSELSEKEYPCEIMSKEEIAELLETYAEGNSKIAEEYLHEPGAELFDGTIKDLPKWEKDNPYMIDDVIRFIGVLGMELYEEQKMTKQELKKLYYIRHPFRAVCKLLSGRSGRNRKF